MGSCDPHSDALAGEQRQMVSFKHKGRGGRILDVLASCVEGLSFIKVEIHQSVFLAGRFPTAHHPMEDLKSVRD